MGPMISSRVVVAALRAAPERRRQRQSRLDSAIVIGVIALTVLAGLWRSIF